MARGRLTTWTCFCERENDVDSEVCPSCGRQREFVLTAQAQGSTPGPDGRDARSRRRLPRFSLGTLRSTSWNQWREQHPGLAQALVTLVLLGLIYWATTIIVAYVTQPNLVMTAAHGIAGEKVTGQQNAAGR